MSRAKLLLLCLLPALVVPRGVALDWCLCLLEASDCCTSCCEVEDPAEGMDCESCHSIEVEDFEEVLSGAPPRLPSFDLVAMAPVSPVVASIEAPTPRRLAPRAPPRLTPPGLRPGAAPLRL